MNEKVKCKLCGEYYCNEDMSEEHYPTRSVGNEDIVSFNFSEYLSVLSTGELNNLVINEIKNGKNANDILGDIFDTKLSKSIYPKGRTAKTLCRECNSFLGKYDEAYLKFFTFDGDSKIINGFTIFTKYQIIKSIFGKFLSLSETSEEEFDFIDFVRNESNFTYSGKWKLYFIKRDISSDLMGFKDLSTGKLTFDEGVVYEFSDDKFIFNLMNFEKHSCYPMSNILDILSKNYNIIEGVGSDGGYHFQILFGKMFENIEL